MEIFAQQQVPGGWVRLGIVEDGGILWWAAVGGNFTAQTFADPLDGVAVLGAGYCGGERVVKYQAERVSGVAWPVCQDWIRDRM